MLFSTSMRPEANERIEQTLEAEAELAGELLARGAAAPPGGDTWGPAELDPEADRIGHC